MSKEEKTATADDAPSRSCRYCNPCRADSDYRADSQGCSGSTDVLKGKWDLDGTTAYEFSGDGNGALLLPNVTYEFTYKIKKDQISIDYENESVRDGTYTFRVEEDKLTLIGGEGTAAVGKVYELTLVKEE